MTVRSGPVQSVRLAHGDRCRDCSASIIWTMTKNNKRLPVDALPHIAGTVEVLFHDDGTPPSSDVLTGMFREQAEYGSLYVAHMATCTRPRKAHR